MHAHTVGLRATKFCMMTKLGMGPPNPEARPHCSLSILTAIFQGEPGLASFIGAKDDGSGGDNWRYKTCKATVITSPSTNQHPTFDRLDVLPVAQSTVSKY